MTQNTVPNLSNLSGIHLFDSDLRINQNTLPMDWQQMPRTGVPNRKRRSLPFKRRIYNALYCRIQKVLGRYGVRPYPLKIEQYLGMDLKGVMDHIQSQFTEQNGYTWLNYGNKWELDHIKPIGRDTDNDTIEDVYAKLNYKNLQPLDRIRNAAEAANKKGIDKPRRMYRRRWFHKIKG